MFEKVLLRSLDVPESQDLSAYEAAGGFKSLASVLANHSPDELIELVKASGLRGRGGAGFPTGLKWSFVPKDTEKPVYLCCNADEAEPGTFKDRALMENDPHMVIEGILIAAYAIGAATSYFYIRGEYGVSTERVEAALAQAYAKGLLGQNILGSEFSHDIYVHRGAGAYICGEETALLESIEGRRAQPKLKPPFPAVAGIYGCPTVINNVETLSCLPHIVERGTDWFRSIGPESSPGPKLFCVSGQVKKPGLYELPMGISMRELLEDHAGGPLSDNFKAVIPGGVSAPMIPGSDIDVGMDFDSLAGAGSMLGSAGVIALDDTACVVRVAARIMEFFNHESCGKCTPCREGNDWAAKVLRRLEAGSGQREDLDQLAFLCAGIFGNSFCALGDAAAWSLGAALKHFRYEFEQHIDDGECPFH
ncbi:NADH-quinone oxidoreductase subunit NuoF [Pelagibius sp. Alg239-R121]|uniref:NADH-quinone oxidoreductase subunit NuoF n=1 Tax=Pelagibius sp. Alg239-R121 TaxID=2993448 RepID=UPI0024A64B3C|nr:NADH-quinone oxidoreductase subunit NuoF [Pelagibius sp. Alg239-R121]